MKVQTWPLCWTVPEAYCVQSFFVFFKFASKARKRDEQKTFFQKRKESLRKNWMQLLQDFFCWNWGWEKEQEQPQAASEQTNLLKILSKMTTRLFCSGLTFFSRMIELSELQCLLDLCRRLIDIKRATWGVITSGLRPVFKMPLNPNYQTIKRWFVMLRVTRKVGQRLS